MRQNRKLYRYTAGLVLACFLTVLTGLSGIAGHDCCGNCADEMVPSPTHQQTVMVMDGCCPVQVPMEPTCACTFQSSNEKPTQVYALTQICNAGDDQQIQANVIVSTQDGRQGKSSHGSGRSHVEIRPRPGPIYLANQSFLC